jgi:hypothetical protein
MDAIDVERHRSSAGVAPMEPDATSRGALWTGRILSGAAMLFLAFDATMKVLRIDAAVSGTTELGYHASVIVPLGIVQLVCLALYALPRTSVLGAVLWTGYLGGAIATHVRIGNPLFTHILFPVYVAAMLWGGLWLRDQRIRALVPFVTRTTSK